MLPPPPGLAPPPVLVLSMDWRTFRSGRKRIRCVLGANMQMRATVADMEMEKQMVAMRI